MPSFQVRTLGSIYLVKEGYFPDWGSQCTGPRGGEGGGGEWSHLVHNPSLESHGAFLWGRSHLCDSISSITPCLRTFDGQIGPWISCVRVSTQIIYLRDSMASAKHCNHTPFDDNIFVIGISSLSCCKPIEYFRPAEMQFGGQYEVLTSTLGSLIRPIISGTDVTSLAIYNPRDPSTCPFQLPQKS